MKEVEYEVVQELVQELKAGFEKKYDRVLYQLNELYHGRFIEDDAPSMSGFCLLAQSALFDEMKSADVRARSLKSDVELKKSEVYHKLKSSKSDGGKVTETALAQLVTVDPSVNAAIKAYIEADAEFDTLVNFHNLLKEAHITFRSIKPNK